MGLRWYQRQAVEAVWDYFKEKDGAPCVVLPTGSGKTFVIAELARLVVQYGGRVLILAHVKELLTQASEKLRNVVDPNLVGVYSAGLNERTTETPIVVAGIQSVYQRAKELGEFHLIVVDEAHLIPPDGCGRYRTLLEDEKEISPKARLVGLTATPYRLGSGWIVKDRAGDDDDKYDRLLDSIVYEAPIAALISDGTLSRVVGVEAKSSPDFSGVRTVRGDFDESEVEKVLLARNVLVSACQEIVERTKDRKRVVVFCNRCESAREVARLLNRFQRDGEAVVVDGNTPSGERDALVRRFKGEELETDLFGGKLKPLKFVCNVGVLTTGFDAPNVDAVALLRPTKSLALYQQMIGRGLRTAPNKKDCLVLDFGGNVERHGPIDLATPRTSTNASRPWKKCPDCGVVLALGYARCPYCGYEFPQSPKKGPSDPNKNLEGEASKKAILSSDEPPIVNEYDVKSVSYSEHRKKDADPDAPATLQVKYKVVGEYRPIFEWLCPEHEGWPRKNFEKWWKAKTDAPFPVSAEAAAKFASDGGLAKPLRIQTKKKAGDRFARVEWLEQGEKPDPATVKDSEAEFLEEFDEFAAFDGTKTEPVEEEEEPARRCETCANWNDYGLEDVSGFCWAKNEERSGLLSACAESYEERKKDEEVPF